MDSREGLRVIATLVGAGFLIYATRSVFRGALYDADEGHVDQATRPFMFWSLVLGMILLGLLILGVGWQWPIVGAIARIIGHR